MAKDLGIFIDKGDESKQPRKIRNKLGSGKIISRVDNRTDLEYYLQTGCLPRKTGNCDLCVNLGKTELCDKCTGMNNLFILITLNEAKLRREKEKENKNGKQH